MIDKKQLIEELLECVNDATDTQTAMTGMTMCAILMNEVIDQALILTDVSQRSKLLKALIGKEENATLLNGKKCRVLKSVEESFLIQENHNDKIRWVGISEIDTKSL